jgi:ABC-type glycerol-3-phosphate transport system substrate-binding protein
LLKEEDIFMRVKKILAVSTALLIAAGLSACGGGGEGGGGAGGNESGGAVAMTFWHNATTGDGKAFWAATVADFEAANPGVKMTVQAIQNEDMDGKLQTALNSGEPPDIFMARGGGKLADIVEAEQVMDLTDSIDAASKSALGEGVLTAFTVDGKVYGMPTSVLPGGMYYSKDLYKKAGITDTPKTFADMNAAVEKLKGADIEPIALGAKDAWPAAHYYYFYALRNCSKDTMDAAAKEKSFKDPCWLKAGEDLQAFAATEPFNKGFLTTSAQQGAGSSAGLLANHKAAMELMGAWEPGVVASLTPDQKPLADLAWFPFPAIEGGQGDPAAMMGGVDGYACSAKAPKECPAFLNFYMQKKYQENYAKAFQTLPASKEAQAVVTDPALKTILESYNSAPYVTLWLDTTYGQSVGNALNTGVVNMLAGKGDPASIVQAMNDAAAKG